MLELQELADGKIWNMKHAKRAIRSVLYTFVLQLIHTTDCISVLQTGQRNRDTRPYRLLLLPLPMAAPPSRIICCRQWIHQAIPPLPMTNPFARPICDTRVHTLDTAAPNASSPSTRSEKDKLFASIGETCSKTSRYGLFPIRPIDETERRKRV